MEAPDDPELRDILLRSFARSPGKVEYPHNYDVLARNTKLQDWARRYQAPDPVAMKGDPELELNPTQVRAVATMLGQRISLIQGVSNSARCCFVCNSP